jgi:type IV pilus assembly protein PilB
MTQVQQIRESMQQRRGLVLFAGPKNQGRTVTMLTAVNELNKPANEISSVEEPVEVYLEGVNQTSISSGDKTTMVKAIKSSLLLSPDALVVSEIKNAEVARVVMEAAESGQYLLSTVFAQSWADALLRMRNWSGGTPSLLDSISMIVVQKLVRRLCSECKAASQVDDAVLLEFGFLQAEINDGISLFEATGCQKCHGGYRGRAGVFEVMALTPDVLKAAIDGADIGAVETLHKSIKHPVDHLDFHRSALRLAKAGVTSMDEIRGVLT